MKSLFDKFMAGNTTGDEERRLFEYFADGNTVEPELEQYRAMMQWYASLAAQAAPQQHHRVSHVRIMRWLYAAASIALVVTIGYMAIHHYEGEQDLYAEYSGSYVMRNGVKSEDISEILPELQRVEQLAETRRRQVVATIEKRIHETPEYNPTLAGHNPKVSAMIRTALSE